MLMEDKLFNSIMLREGIDGWRVVVIGFFIVLLDGIFDILIGFVLVVKVVRDVNMRMFGRYIYYYVIQDGVREVNLGGFYVIMSIVK